MLKQTIRERAKHLGVGPDLTTHVLSPPAVLNQCAALSDSRRHHRR